MTGIRTIGVVGGGQLARMMAPAAAALGLNLKLLAEAPGSSAAQVIADVTVGDYADAGVLGAFASGCDAITFDHEHVPTDLLRDLKASGVLVRPGPDALEHAQDKAVMRARLTALGLPCPRWRVVDSAADLVAFGRETGWPVIAKLSRGGYDGKGVFKIESDADANVPFAALEGPLGPTERESATSASGPRPVILAEEFIDFTRELSVIVARGADGRCLAYPVTETVQADGICRETTTPAPALSAERADTLQALGIAAASELGVVGLLAVELMELADGSVVVNELAMRPHNTGHWAIDGARTSQFENHLRAVAGLPLGPTDATAAVAVMSNILGGSRDDLVGGLADVLAADPALRVQLYGKAVKPGRKVGHVTALGDDLATVAGRARAASEALEGRRTNLEEDR